MSVAGVASMGYVRTHVCLIRFVETVHVLMYAAQGRRPALVQMVQATGAVQTRRLNASRLLTEGLDAAGQVQVIQEFVNHMDQCPKCVVIIN